MITLIHGQQQLELDDAQADVGAEAGAEAGSLWLDAAAIEAATGWAWKPEGLCRDETCVPVPPERREAWLRGSRLDLAALWRHMGQPVLHDAAGQIWVLGSGAAQRAAALDTLQAPDFELPDGAGRRHRLSDFRGRKVFLATWASW